MSYVIVGLGNPGEEYAGTRHNAGRIMLEFFRKKHDFSEWEKNGSLDALVSTGKVGGKAAAKLVEPETFMNKSGASVKPLVKSEKAAEKVIVIYDDLDLPLGRFKISFNRSSGGHRGLESIIKNLKTEAFLRIRVGISPSTPMGKLKKPSGDKAVEDFILGQFKKPELDDLKKLSKAVNEAIETLVLEGREAAMNSFNQQ